MATTYTYMSSLCEKLLVNLYATIFDVAFKLERLQNRFMRLAEKLRKRSCDLSVVILRRRPLFTRILDWLLDEEALARYDPVTNTIYVFLDTHRSPEDLVNTIVHETVYAAIYSIIGEKAGYYETHKIIDKLLAG